jgi:hypothetical protein
MQKPSGWLTKPLVTKRGGASDCMGMEHWQRSVGAQQMKSNPDLGV